MLAVLEDAAVNQLIDLPLAIEKLRATSVFLSDEVVETVLRRHRERTAKKL
jgi:hypothetical protein